MLRLILLAAILTSCRQTPGLPKKDDAGIGVRDANTPDAVVVDSTTIDSNVDAAPPGPDASHIASVVLMIGADGQDMNCSSPGAGISTMTEEVLSNHLNECIVAHTVHQRNGALVEEYDTVCQQMQLPRICYEKGDLMTIRPLDPGGYHVVVMGMVNSVPCWIGDASVGAIEGVASTQLLILLHQHSCQ